MIDSDKWFLTTALIFCGSVPFPCRIDVTSEWSLYIESSDLFLTFLRVNCMIFSTYASAFHMDVVSGLDSDKGLH